MPCKEILDQVQNSDCTQSPDTMSTGARVNCLLRAFFNLAHQDVFFILNKENRKCQ